MSNATENSSIGRRLRVYLNMNRMTAGEFAERFGIPRRTVEQYVSGRAKPGADALRRMAEGGISLEWLLTGSIKPGLVIDLWAEEGMEPVASVILADDDLSQVLMNEAVFLVDELVAERPKIAGKLGLVGQIKSVWHIYAQYAASFDRVADQVEKARRSGWSTDDVAAIVAGGLRESSRAHLRARADQMLADGADVTTTSGDVADAPRTAA